AIDQAFQQEKFKELDCLADHFRANKDRFAGGQWKLRKLYNGVADQTTHATEEDWKLRLKRLQRWTQVNPQSATARIPLAEAYTNYAWAARGDGYTDTVSQSGWDLLGERMKKAREILEQNSNLKTKCPQWYLVMLQVAQGEGWDHRRAAALMQEAAAFEPTYD